MATFIRRAAMGALVLVGLLAGQNAAQAQFAFGWTPYGYNSSNPYIAQQQYYNNLRTGSYAISSGQAVPAWLPYVAPYAAYSPYVGYSSYGSYGYSTPTYNPYLYRGYTGYGVSPYLGYRGYRTYRR